jgi:hypothetical protein
MQFHSGLLHKFLTYLGQFVRAIINGTAQKYTWWLVCPRSHADGEWR